jgi:hypothetical protein
MLDLVPRQPDLEQLPARDHAMLPRRDLGDHRLYRGRSYRHRRYS